MRVETDTWSLELPKGWSVAVGSDDGAARLFYKSDAQHERHQSTIEWKGADIGLALIAVPAGAGIGAYAEAMMKRHVAQGEPERYSRLVGGRSAHAYRWTDGVNNIETYFVEATSGVVLRIDIATAALGNYSGTATDARSSAELIIGTLAWTGSSR